MTRNYDHPITILFSGSGMSSLANTSALLEDFVFGNADDVDAKVILVDRKHPKGLSIAVDILNSWKIDEASGDLSIVPDFDSAIDALGNDICNGRDGYFISFFDKNNAEDLAEVTLVKSRPGVVTLNLCESLVDHFEGYESEADRIHREAVEEAFAEQQAVKEAEAPKPARKTAAKKATAKPSTPRKRAASKTLEPETKELTEDDQKPPVASPVAKGWGPHVHRFVWADDGNGHSGSVCECGESEELDVPLTGTHALVAKAVQREADKKAAKNELSGTIVMNTPKLPADLEPVKPLATTPDVWEDVAKSVPAQATHINITKEDFLKLGSGIQKMAEGFAETLEVYKGMIG